MAKPKAHIQNEPVAMVARPEPWPAPPSPAFQSVAPRFTPAAQAEREEKIIELLMEIRDAVKSK